MKHKKLGELKKFEHKLENPEEIRDEVETMWEANKTMILQTAAVVTVVAVVATAFFLGRTRILNMFRKNSWFNSGLALGHKLADKAVAMKDKVLDTAESVAHAVTERAHGLN